MSAGLTLPDQPPVATPTPADAYEALVRAVTTLRWAEPGPRAHAEAYRLHAVAGEHAVAAVRAYLAAVATAAPPPSPTTL